MARRLENDIKERRKRIGLVALTVITAVIALANLGVYLWAIENDKGRLAVILNSFQFSVLLLSVFLGVLLGTPGKLMRTRYLKMKRRTS